MTDLPKGLVMEGRYSFAIKKLEGAPTSAELLNIDKENEKILRASAIWQDPVEVEELDHISIELRRQDMKISLLLDLVGELLIRQSEMPDLELIQITATGIEFSEEICSFDIGDEVEASLYLLPAFPRPLHFHGGIAKSERPGFCAMNFQGTSVAVQDQIEKIIFTHHRRSIAQEHAGTAR